MKVATWRAPQTRLHRIAAIVRCAAFAAAISGTAYAQSILVTEYRGKTYPVVGAREMHPIIEVDGKRVSATGDRYGLRKVPEFLPAFVTVSALDVHTSSINLVDNGSMINNEFHFRANFESPYALEDVFLVLELTFENSEKSLFLHELGRLEPHKARSLTLTVRTAYPLGKGNYQFHLFAGGLEILHSQLPFNVRESMLDGLIARRIEHRPDGPPVVLFGPAPELPGKRGKFPGGKAVVRMRIRETGAVIDPAIVETTDPALGEAVLGAVRQWRFLPRIKNGHAVETVATLPVDMPSDIETAAKH